MQEISEETTDCDRRSTKANYKHPETVYHCGTRSVDARHVPTRATPLLVRVLEPSSALLRAFSHGHTDRPFE